MIGRNDSAHDAIARWERAGLVDARTADSLRAELRQHAEGTASRLAQYLLATAGAIVLIIAGGVFIDWAWPILGERARTFLLALTGVAVLAGGLHLEGRNRWRPAALLMQAGAVALIFSAYVYSERAWEPESAAGIVIGLAALVTPIVLTARAMRRNVFMPAVNMVASMAFLAVFLGRSTSLSADAVVWTLDAVLAAAILVFVVILRRDPDGETHPWALNAFVAAMGGGFLLVGITAFETLDMGDEGLLPLDAWLALCAATTIWGLHRAPAGLRKDWFEHLLALELGAWILFGGVTVFSTYNGPPEAYVLVVGGVGVAAFVYADRFRFQQVMGVATLAFIIPIWYWAVDRGGALGGVLALLGTAAFLFWASGRRDKLREGG